MKGRRKGAGAASTASIAAARLSTAKERALGRQAAERQRIGRARKAHERRHVALHAGAVDEHRAQRDPVEVEPGKAALGIELRVAVGIGRRRLAAPP